jgi:hypothetical protein
VWHSASAAARFCADRTCAQLSLAGPPRGGTILDIPEKLFVLNATKPRPHSLLEGDGDIGLGALFGSPAK